jgi:acetylornithine/N-succinyldiaminopimelate aminotransferase
MNTLEQIAELERQYLLQTYNRYPIAFSRGKGVFLFDLEGKRYLDFVSGLGVNALGHAHPRIVKAIREQAAKLVHISNLYYHEYQGPLAEKLCQLSGLNRAFFSNSGTEAIEGSIKLARLAGHRAGGAAKSRLVALDGSYHGRTFGALSLTGQDKHRKGFEPLLEDVTFVKQNDLASLRAAISDETCAIVLEPVFGEGGIYECSVEFLQECRALADRHRAALIFDEIQCGLGRTGTIFAFQSFGVTPDIVAIAKPIAAGLPLGAFIAKEEFASAISPGQHGTTFGGGPLACRVALEFLAIVEEEKLLENVNKVGAYLQQELKALAEKSAAAREVRGRGFIQGIELEIPARPIVDAGLAEGVLFNSTQDTVVRFLPPFLLEEKHVDKGIRVLKKLLGKKRKKAA